MEGLKRLEKFATLCTNCSRASQYEVIKDMAETPGDLALQKWSGMSVRGHCQQGFAISSHVLGAWKQEKESDIIFLGVGLSPPLGSREFLRTLALGMEGGGPSNLAAI